MCQLRPPLLQQTKTDIGLVVESVDSQWLAARLNWTGSIRSDDLATAGEWQEWWRQCKMIPQNAWYDLRKAEIPSWLVRGKPLTQLAHLARLTGQTITYPNGQTFRFEQLPGLATRGTAYRLDQLLWTTSAALIPHEFAHVLDYYILGTVDHPLSDTAEWRYLHTVNLWWTSYETTYPREALAESFAVKVSRSKPLAQNVSEFWDRIFMQRNWQPWPPSV